MPLDPQDRSTSFNRPELVRFDSLRDSKDLGPVEDLKAELCGFIGAEAGTQSLFFSFELLVPGAIQVQVVNNNKWTARFLSVSLRSETGTIGLDALGNARGVDIVNTCSVDEALSPFPPGKYVVVVGCSQWQATPFCLRIRASPTTRLTVALTGRGGLGLGRSRLRVGTAKLQGALTGNGYLRAQGSGLFSGRRDKPLAPTRLTGRGQLGGELSIREPLRSLAGAFLSGSGGLGRSTPTSNQLGPTMWVSRLTTLTEMSSGAAPAVTLVDGDYSYQVFYFRPAGSVASQQRLAIVYRDPQGIELWMRITDIFVDAQDIGGWLLMPLPGNDALIYNVSGLTFSTLYGLYVMRIHSNGTVAWKKQIAVSSPVGTGSTSNNNDISQIRDATYHFGLNLVIFSITISSHRPAFLYLDPIDGSYHSCRALVGLQLTAGGFFGTQHVSNGPLIKADGRMILTGGRSVAPVYSWVIETDALCTTVNQFWKYTDGTNLNYALGAALHPDGSITLYGSDDEKLTLNPDFTIRGRTRQQGSTLGGRSFSARQFVVDSDGSIYSGGGFTPSILSMEQEGAVAYRGLTVSGMPGRTDQTSARKPAKWFNIATRYAIASPDAANAGSGLGCLMFGYDIDMAPTTVSGTGYALTIGESEGVVNTIPLPFSSLIIQRYPDELGGSISTPIFFDNAFLVADTSAPAWNPNFIDASTILAFERHTSTIRRTTNVTIPRLKIKENPAIEPDPYKPFVTFHLAGSGVADTCVFVDRGPFSLSPAQIQGGPRHSIEQARFPDLGGFFESTSIRFDGTEDAIVYGSSPAFRIGRQDFTLETWIYRLNGNFTLFDNALLGDPASHINSFALFIAADGRPRFQTNSTGGDGGFFGGGSDYRRFVPLATWTHVAISREDTIWRVHVGGVLDSSGRLLDTDLTAAGLLIGRGCQPIGTAYQLVAPFGNFGGEFIFPVGFNGFLADTRFTLGVARYHRSFQPRNAPIQYVPTGPPLSLPAGAEPAETLIPSTDLFFNETLLFVRGNGNSNFFFDDGPWAHTLIPFGSITQASGGKWAGNRMVLDGFGDYLDTVASPNLSVGAGDFTIELWATRTGDSAGAESFQVLIDSRTAEPSRQILLRVNRAATGRQVVLYVDGAIRILGEPMVTNTRYHIALVRSAGSIRLYMNGTQVGATWEDATNYTADDWFIGQGRISVAGDPWSFHGDINDVRILRRAIYPSAQFPPDRPIGTPPTATARYWQLFDLRFSTTVSQTQIHVSELALHQGRDRIPNTTATSSSAPIGGTLALTQDLSTTTDCVWTRTNMEQVDAFIQLDAGAPVTVDAVRLASASPAAGAITGFSLRYSDDLVSWTTLGHAIGYTAPTSALTRRIALLPLPTDPGDGDFDKVSMRLLFNEAGTGVLDSGPRELPIIAVNTTKTTISSVEGGQSLWLNAASNAYLTLGGPGTSVFFSFGTGALTVDIDIFPLTVPPVRGILFDTNGIGGSAALSNGFQLALTSAMTLDVFINNAWQGASVQTIPLNAWTRVRLRRNGAGLWEYVIGTTLDATTFTNTVNCTSRTFTIGRTGANGTDLNWLNAYIDRVVVTRGLART
jgi:hypothetical protein